MPKNNLSARITLWVNRIIIVLLLALLPSMPWLLNWYNSTRILTPAKYYAILIGFYCCAIVVAPALWKMDKLLRNILREKVFVRENVRLIRFIRGCCAAVSLICLPAGCIYYPLIFMVVIMAFLCLAVSVLVQVMDAAVSLREENELTI